MRLRIMRWVILLSVLLSIQGIYAQSILSHPVDEIIGYDLNNPYGKTDFAVFQYENEAFLREGSITYYTQYLDWFTGDIDGDGIDEIIAYDIEGDTTRFIFFQQNGSKLTREGGAIHYGRYTGWSAGDIDGDGIDEIIAYDIEGDTTRFIFFQQNGSKLTREGEVKRVPGATGWIAGDIDGAGVDEIITYDMDGPYGKTEFAIFQYVNEAFLREGSITYYTRYTGWLTGDINGDGIDEIIAYDIEGDTTRFIFFQQNGSKLVKKGEVKSVSSSPRWLSGDIDEALEIISYSPPDAILKQEVGQTLTFRIEAVQSDGASPWYRWELDGTEVDTSMEWNYTPGYKSTGPHRVTGFATDGKLSVLREWIVNVGGSNRPPSIVLRSPKAGDVLVNNVDIIWNASDPDGNVLTVDIAYSSNGGKVWETLTSGEDNDGIFTWDTSDEDDGEYVLKIVANDPYGLSDESLSGSFFIGNLPPKVEFISRGGKINGVQKVSWHTYDALNRSASVVLSVSSDGGKTWKTLTSGGLGNGTFSWDTEKVPSGNYILRITAGNEAGKSRQTLKVIVDNPEYGSVYISSTPKGASIIIEGKDFGKTNKKVEISAGYHTVELQKKRYSPWTRGFEVKKGENPDINARLTPDIYGFSPAYIFAVVLGVLLLAGILFYVKGAKK